MRYVDLLSGAEGTLLARIPEPADATDGRFGSSLAGLGDMNGDGWEDLMIGATRADERRGALYLYCGRTLRVLYRHSSPAEDPQQLAFSETVRAVGDLDQDGLPDYAVCAPYFNDPPGSVFIYRGNDLYLQARSRSLSSGDPLELDLRGGMPGGRAFLAVVEAQGEPLFRLIARGRFDSHGEYEYSAVVPPGVSGLEIGLQGWGPSMRQPGAWVDSAVERVTIE